MGGPRLADLGSVVQVEALHRLQIEHYGGGRGFGSGAPWKRPPPGPLSLSGVRNYGNKRVGAHAALVFLFANGWEAAIKPVELEEVTTRLASSELDLESLTIWFRQRGREGR